MKEEPLVRVEGLERRYGPVHAVRGLDFRLYRGQVVGFLGVNGAGKSTTLAMLAGVLAPTRGRIEICGHDLARAPAAAKARLGYLPDTPPLYDSLTVDEYLAFCAGLHGLHGGERRDAVAEAKRRCGLEQVGARVLGNLSKGFRQRAGIAQAIVHNPQVLLLDEPTTGLDPVQIREIRLLVRDLGRRHAVVLSSHILQEVQAICDRVQIVHEGRLVHEQDLDASESTSNEYRLRLARAGRAGALDALPGVRSVHAVSDREIRLTLDGTEPAPTILRALIARELEVNEFAPIEPSLEDLFVSIATSERAISAPSAAA